MEGVIIKEMFHVKQSLMSVESCQLSIETKNEQPATKTNTINNNYGDLFTTLQFLSYVPGGSLFLLMPLAQTWLVRHEYIDFSCEIMQRPYDS